MNCLAATSHLVTTDTSPNLRCIATPIVGCDTYTNDGSNCSTCDGLLTLVVTDTAPLVICTNSLISGCSVYSADVSTCVTCHTETSHLVTIVGGSSPLMCIATLIDGCDNYTSDGSDCNSCSPGLNLVTITGPWRMCISTLI